MPTQSEVMELIQRGRPEEALTVCRAVLEEEGAGYEWWYCAGQALRALERFDEAVRHLTRASELSDGNPSVVLALGISLQLAKDYEEAKIAFARVLDRDPDNVLAYNSLALTQKRLGEFDKAEQNLEGGLKALSRQFVKQQVNGRESSRLPAVSVPGEKWIECALFAGLHWASTADVDGVAWPTDAMAADEERTCAHDGLYFVDSPTPDGRQIRLFLPNFFNTFQHWLASTRHYATLLGNLATVLEIKGRQQEADECFREAAAFTAGTEPQQRSAG